MKRRRFDATLIRKLWRLNEKLHNEFIIEKKKYFIEITIVLKISYNFLKIQKCLMNIGKFRFNLVTIYYVKLYTQYNFNTINF